MRTGVLFREEKTRARNTVSFQRSWPTRQTMLFSASTPTVPISERSRAMAFTAEGLSMVTDTDTSEVAIRSTGVWCFSKISKIRRRKP